MIEWTNVLIAVSSTLLAIAASILGWIFIKIMDLEVRVAHLERTP